MFDAAINSRFTELLYRMNSTLIECPSSHFFITSDSPVSLYHPLDSPEDAFGKGLYDKHIELFCLFLRLLEYYFVGGVVRLARKHPSRKSLNSTEEQL